MEFHLSDILISILNIFVLFLLLRIILWKHVNKFLADRRERIRSETETAEQMRKDAEALQAEYKHRLDNFDRQGAEIIAESRAEAELESLKIIDEGKAEAAEMLREAEARIEEERKQAVIDAQADIVHLATEMAAQILKREVTPFDNVKAADVFFEDTQKNE